MSKHPLAATPITLSAMASFPSYYEAIAVKRKLYVLFEREEGRVQVVEPNDPFVEQKLEPAYTQFGRYAVRTHLRSGMVGLVLGLCLWGVMYLSGHALIVSTYLASCLALCFVGVLVGLAAGGLFAYKHSANQCILPTKKAIKEGKWVVLVYTANARLMKKAQRIMAAALDPS